MNHSLGFLKSRAPRIRRIVMSANLRIHGISDLDMITLLGEPLRFMKNAVDGTLALSAPMVNQIALALIFRSQSGESV